MTERREFFAEWLVPINSPPIRGGGIRLGGSRILELLPPAVTGAEKFLPPNSLILPGFVNAHTHLEFSDLKVPLGFPGIKMPAWIAEVLRYRQAQAKTGDLEILRESAIRQGMSESTKFGVAALADISTKPWLIDIYKGMKLHVVPLLEQLGLAPQSVVDRFRELETPWENARGPGRQPQAGLSPHAPYSLHPELLKSMISLGEQEDALVAMHLAESREELQFLETHSGAFAKFLIDRSLWDPTQPTCAIDQCLELLSGTTRGLIVHGNYLQTRQLDWIASFPELSLVYCPRTHDYFGHSRYPLEEILLREIRVVVGTDSRASNPDLDVLAELRMIAEKFPEVCHKTILRMGTEGAAKALGLESQFGALRAGTSPGVLAIEFIEPIGDDPVKTILTGKIKSRFWLDRD